jgi:hypothetical protein
MHTKVVRLLAGAPAAFTPRKYSWYNISRLKIFKINKKKTPKKLHV